MSIVTLNDRAVRSVTAFGSLNTGSMIFIKKLTASSSGTLSFVNGSSDVVLDSTYKTYVFTFKNIHPSTDLAAFQFNLSIDGGSNYNVTKTTTAFDSLHKEDGSGGQLAYKTGQDLAQGTGFQELEQQLGNGNDESCSGHLHLFNPSSTTFVKHFIARVNAYQGENYTVDNYTAGYANTTSAVNAVQFKMSSGNIDAGDICLYGIN
jgi:hypothetical protein